MHRGVVAVALRQQVLLRAGVENPQHRFHDRSHRNRLAARAALRDVFLGNVIADPFPLVVAQSQHERSDT